MVVLFGVVISMGIIHCEVEKEELAMVRSEELSDRNNLVCLNDGRSTRVDVQTGIESVINLTLVSSSIAAKCNRIVFQEGVIGSDHYPVWFKII